MSFDIEGFIKNVFDNKTVKTIVNNPIVVAIIVVLILMLIVYYMFYDSIDELGEWEFFRRLAKIGVCGFVLTMGVLIMHYRSMEDEYRDMVTNDTRQEVMREVSKINEPIQTGKGETVQDMAPAALTPHVVKEQTNSPHNVKITIEQ